MGRQQRCPTGDGALVEWDPSTTLPNWQLVDDCSADIGDGDSTFISTSVVGEINLSTIDPFSVQNDSIQSVGVEYVVRLDTGTASVKPVIRVGGVNYEGAVQAVTASYVRSSFEWTTNPQTALPWTRADVNGTGSNPLQQPGILLSAVSGATVLCTEYLADAIFEEVEGETQGANQGGMHPGGEKVVLASAARTASVNSADQVNHNASGVALTIDVTAIAATPSVVFRLKYKDTLSGKYLTLLESAAIVAVGTTVLRVGPALVAAANLTARDVLPVVWRLEAEHADADSITYSASAQYTFGGL